ncbi:MAG: hypothetical protein SGPRY_003402 [Prymnesium sp.]
MAGLQGLTLGMLCSSPPELSYCTATLLCLPFAGVASPLLGLACLVRATLLLLHPKPLSQASSASISRTLHIAAAWNAASLLNAIVGLVGFACSSRGSFITEMAWLISIALLCTKLLVAQALKLLVASSSVSGSAYAFLLTLNQPLPTEVVMVDAGSQDEAQGEE